jgi:Uma2 family endonuclease
MADLTHAPRPIALADFLNRPDIEGSPAWEWLGDRAIQKPMPTLFHSRLQRNLTNTINAGSQAGGDRYEAIPELRCIIAPLSPVPDIAVIASDRLGDLDGPFRGAPDWIVEIRSPDQGTLPLQTKILHCLNHGTQLAWLIDLTRQQIWVWDREELPIICTGTELLPDLGLNLQLTPQAVVQMVHRRS